MTYWPDGEPLDEEQVIDSLSDRSWAIRHGKLTAEQMNAILLLVGPPSRHPPVESRWLSDFYHVLKDLGLGKEFQNVCRSAQQVINYAREQMHGQE